MFQLSCQPHPPFIDRLSCVQGKRKQSLCIIIDLLTCEEVRHCVLILSCPDPARLVQETTPGSGWTVSKAEQCGEVQSMSREVVAKLIGIGGKRWRTTW